MTAPRRGDIWWGELEGVGRRPFLVMTRDAAIPVLANLVCAPITTRVRSIPTELVLDESDGMPRPCAASLDNLQVIPKAMLTGRLAQLRFDRLDELCEAARAAIDC